MKKQIVNLGKALSKAEQKVIHGGDAPDGPCSGENKAKMASGCACTYKFEDRCASKVCNYVSAAFGVCA